MRVVEYGAAPHRFKVISEMKVTIKISKNPFIFSPAVGRTRIREIRRMEYIVVHRVGGVDQ